MSNYQAFIDALEAGVKELAQKTLHNFKDEALTDAKAFLKASQNDLQEWTGQLQNGELSKDDFEWLVQGRKDAAELYALKQAGLAAVKMDQFRTALINLVVNTATSTFL